MKKFDELTEARVRCSTCGPQGLSAEARTLARRDVDTGESAMRVPEVCTVEELVKMPDTPERFVTYVRQWTGKPVSRAHILDRETGEIVASCSHLHKQRRHRGLGPDGAPIVTSSVSYAERCAAKLLSAYRRRSR